MIRVISTVVLLLFVTTNASAQYVWNGPYSGNTLWTAGNWSPSVPPAGGGVGTSLTFTGIGSGSYSAQNNMGPFVLSTLNLTSPGGGISIVGGLLQFAGSASINQNGIGTSVVDASSSSINATNLVLGGSGFGNLRLHGFISGPGSSITVNRSEPHPFTGVIDMTGANSFSGGVTLQNGNLRVGAATSLGSGVFTVRGGTLGATTSNVTVANNVTLEADLVYSGFGGNLTLTGGISESGGSRGLTLKTVGSGQLFLQGTNTYSGPTSIVLSPKNGIIESSSAPIGRLTLRGPNGTAALSSAFSINAGGAVTLDNSASGANNNNRIGDSTPITFAGGSFFLVGGNGTSTTENVGAMSGAGRVAITVNAGTTGNTGTTLQADSLTRLGRSQFLFRGNNANFGSPIGPNVANLIFDTAPALTGGGGAPGSTTMSIIPYAAGAITAADESNASDLVTYGPNGIRPLSTAAGEYASTIVSGTTTAANVRLTSAGAVTAPTQINALVIATSGTAFVSSNSTLTLASGTLVNAVPVLGATIPVGMTVNFGAAEGNVIANSELTLNCILTGSNGLTVGGFVQLGNSANNVTGQLTINNGTVQFSNPAAIASFSNVVVNGLVDGFLGTGQPGFELSGALSSTTINQPMLVNTGFAVLLNASGPAIKFTYGGPISGDGGVRIVSSLSGSQGVELTNTANSYTGATRVAGILHVSSDAVLGNGGGVEFNGPSTVILTGPWTTSRHVNFSDATQVDTNGFDWTIQSPVTGYGGTITKVGAGRWILGAGGALGQSLVSGTTLPQTTINVNAGELRAVNPTGSATGSATINVNNTSIISGTGTFAGATTIASTAFLDPGTGGTTIATLSFSGTFTLNGTYTAHALGLISDNVSILSALTLGAASVLDLPLTNTYDAATTYTLMQFASRTGTFGSALNIPPTHTLVYNPTNVLLVPVPEPVAILGIAGLALAIGRMSRRRPLRLCTTKI